MSTSERPFLTARWAHLAMLTFVVGPALVQPWVPHGTELDTWNGLTFVSVVGFQFSRTRLLGVLPVPGHRQFPEVNLRLYVRRTVSASDIRRGVTFLREIVPRRAIALIAQRAYQEPYRALAMRASIARTGRGPISATYAWRHRSRWNILSIASADGTLALPAPGSHAHFITEHYWGYTPQRDGSTIEYEVRHPPWRVWSGVQTRLACELRGGWDERLEQALSAKPYSALIAEGSDVIVHRPRRLPAADERRDDRG